MLSNASAALAAALATVAPPPARPTVPQERVGVQVVRAVSGPATAQSGKLGTVLGLVLATGARFAGHTRSGLLLLDYASHAARDEALQALQGNDSVLSAQPAPLRADVEITELVLRLAAPSEASWTGTSLSAVLGEPQGLRPALAEMPVVDRVRPSRSVVIRPPNGIDAELLAELLERPEIEQLEPHWRYALIFSVEEPDDPDLAWDVYSAHLDHIGAAYAWVEGLDEVVVAVLDTGIDPEHEDLANVLARNEVEEAGAPGFDDDGNGYVDDVLGWDFFDDDADPCDENGHGTHCAGVIAAEHDNGVGTSGVAPNARVLPIRLFGADGTSDVPEAKFAEAFDYAVARGARVLSNSWGSPYMGRLLAEAIGRANRAGALVVASAGQVTDGPTGLDLDLEVNALYPACYTDAGLLAVLGWDPPSTWISSFNFGATSVDLGAPGRTVWSASSTCDSTARLPYGYRTGSSPAAAMVSGAAAAVLGLPRFAGLTPAQLATLLRDRARPETTLAGRCASEGSLWLGFLSEEEPETTPIAFAPPSGDPLVEEPLVEREPRRVVAVEGVVERIAAIGGETSGLRLRTARGAIELELPRREGARALGESLIGRRVRVLGSTRVARGVERGAFRVLRPVATRVLE